MDGQELTLRVEERENLLYVYTSGIRSRETVKTITQKVFAAALEKHYTKVLVDIRDLIGEFGFMDIYYFVTDVLKEFRGKGVDQVAILDIRRSPNPGWFLEPVAQNRGFNFRVFAEDQSALKWLGG